MAVSSSEFALKCGYTVHLVELRQHRTYESLLEGVPTRERNSKSLEYMVASVAATFPQHKRPILLPCTETIIPWDEERPYPFGTPSKLPEITCVGRFYSRREARDGDWSELIVIWLQDEFAMPISEHNLSHLLEVDWPTMATDFDY